MVDEFKFPQTSTQEAWAHLLAHCVVPDDRGERALEPGFARRFLDARVRSFAELGGGSGPISTHLEAAGVTCVVVDRMPQSWHALPYEQPGAVPGAPPPAAVVGDLLALPLRPASLDGASAVNCLYFLDDPTTGLRAARDALRPGGLFLASAPDRFHDPELRDVTPRWGEPSPFDGEDAAEIVGRVFDDLEAEHWEWPAYLLRDHRDVAMYLRAFGAHVEEVEQRAPQVRVPTHVTKSGTNVWARA